MQAQDADEGGTTDVDLVVAPEPITSGVPGIGLAVRLGTTIAL